MNFDVTCYSSSSKSAFWMAIIWISLLVEVVGLDSSIQFIGTVGGSLAVAKHIKYNHHRF